MGHGDSYAQFNDDLNLSYNMTNFPSGGLKTPRGGYSYPLREDNVILEDIYNAACFKAFVLGNFEVKKFLPSGLTNLLTLDEVTYQETMDIKEILDKSFDRKLPKEFQNTSPPNVLGDNDKFELKFPSFSKIREFKEDLNILKFVAEKMCSSKLPWNDGDNSNFGAQNFYLNVQIYLIKNQPKTFRGKSHEYKSFDQATRDALINFGNLCRDFDEYKQEVFLNGRQGADLHFETLKQTYEDFKKGLGKIKQFPGIKENLPTLLVSVENVLKKERITQSRAPFPPRSQTHVSRQSQQRL